jgi:DNA-binding beta-propeller fold protein YncE
MRKGLLKRIEQMALMRAASRLGLLLVAVVFLALVPTVAGAEDTVAFTIKDARITESSGLAVDPAGNLYWTVNDSGDRGVAYGIGLDGKVQGTLNFRAQPRDVEAVAVHEDRLYVADIGDNNGRRRFVRVYFFNNPRANGLTVTYHAYDFRYPDGPQDAETLLVDDSGRLFIVTKGQEAAIYEAPAKPDRQGVNDLEEVGSAPSNVTDGTFLPGGDRIALLTYSSVEVLDATSYEVMASARIPDQPQAESLTLSLDERSLLVGSEGKKSKVYSMPVPSEATPTPTPEAGTDPGGETDVPDDEAAFGQGQQGTLLALGLAAFVALVAGMVVAFAGKPS